MKNKDNKSDSIDLGSYAHWLLTEAIISTMNFAEINKARRQNKVSLKDYRHRWSLNSMPWSSGIVSKEDALKSLGKHLKKTN